MNSNMNMNNNNNNNDDRRSLLDNKNWSRHKYRDREGGNTGPIQNFPFFLDDYLTCPAVGSPIYQPNHPLISVASAIAFYGDFILPIAMRGGGGRPLPANHCPH